MNGSLPKVGGGRRGQSEVPEETPGSHLKIAITYWSWGLPCTRIEPWPFSIGDKSARSDIHVGRFYLWSKFQRFFLSLWVVTAVVVVA